MSSSSRILVTLALSFSLSACGSQARYAEDWNNAEYAVACAELRQSFYDANGKWPEQDNTIEIEEGFCQDQLIKERPEPLFSHIVGFFEMLIDDAAEHFGPEHETDSNNASSPVLS